MELDSLCNYYYCLPHKIFSILSIVRHAFGPFHEKICKVLLTSQYTTPKIFSDKFLPWNEPFPSSYRKKMQEVR